MLMGNGLNGDSRALSTRAIVAAFVARASSRNPRGYDEDIRRVRKLADTLSSEGTDPDMTEFLSCFGATDKLREEFVSHVVESCCLEKPATEHTLTLMLCHVLKAEPPSHRLIAFTTNYDNLLERAYLRAITSGHDRRHVSRAEAMLYQKDAYEVLRLTPPEYTLGPAHARKAIPVVPIHGCISVCRCPLCLRSLRTEATALGSKKCVYCGGDIPPLVVPTKEGGADKSVLALLEEEISKAEVCIFVGCGFGDPHIIERVRKGLGRNRRGARLLNLCRAPLPSQVKVDAASALDMVGDIHMGLVRLLDAYKQLAGKQTCEWVDSAFQHVL
jgi:NAD-dependent SIR2 family protein deacetylase